MRKLIVSMNMTLDGFISGPDCELDWHFQSWTTEMAETLCKQLGRADTIVLGRVTYVAMAKYWPSKLQDPFFSREDIAFADMINRYRKIVFSKTLSTTVWHNSRLVNGDLKEEIIKLKTQDGKDMIIYGSGKLVSALIKMHLIDEFLVWVHPVVIGEGKALFKKTHGKMYLQLLNTTTFSSGVTVLHYKKSISIGARP
jgi:dihydrofolate reductase